MRLVIFSMGGTIDKVYFDDLSDYVVGEPQAGAIMVEAGVTLSYRVEEVLRKDSLHLTDQDRELLRQRVAQSPERKVVVTHGTDTMVESAKALAGFADKVIVFTGALSPARFKGSDAPFNLGLAVGAAQSLAPGVYIAMSGHIFPADKVRKNREAGRFEYLS